MNSGTLVAMAGALLAWGGLCVYLKVLSDRLDRALDEVRHRPGAEYAPKVTVSTVAGRES